MYRAIIFFILSFLVGTIPTGYLLLKITRKEDIRNLGSGNIGFTNVLRAAGLLSGIVVLLIDTGKAFAAAYFLSNYFDTPSLFRLLFGISVILGNTFNPFLKFRGGKGVAAGLGVALAINPYSAIFCVAAFSFVVLISKYISLGSLTAAAVFLISNALFHRYHQKNLWAIIFAALLFVAIYLRHISNIKRLFKGEEKKIGKRKQ
jgi:glycerol-3-phosphate acyltransferase PlsY